MEEERRGRKREEGEGMKSVMLLGAEKTRRNEMRKKKTSEEEKEVLKLMTCGSDFSSDTRSQWENIFCERKNY